MATYSARPSPSAFSTPASTTLFRRLTWEGTVPLEIRVDSKELPANSDRGLECYYIQAPRVSYLPLLVPELKRFLMDVVFDEAAARVIKEEDWWFESEDGTLLKCAYGAVVVSLDDSITTEACKQAFMGQMKEADFIRWGNTKRMTGLRKAEQDGLWEGIKEHSFDEYWRVAAKITPTTTPTRSTSPPPAPSSTSLHSRPPSVDPNTGGGVPDRDGAYNVRSVPVRIYLPDGPILQDLVPPTLDDGK
ncbi:hypothetical protein EW026_g5604 [Hermanssonia centrifuga]|uniref:Uncharacterized protein n=1 Tax=Hermanssonia centrifuga TaxID=98765 RepID=A0A4S4KFC4_9APHY|nr:hypothetical protein EW026_g5604 [Hermanssonia centrifuga]